MKIHGSLEQDKFLRNSVVFGWPKLFQIFEIPWNGPNLSSILLFLHLFNQNLLGQASVGVIRDWRGFPYGGIS